MSGKLAFKIEALPKLEGQSNHTCWAGAIRLTLKTYEFWDIADGTRERPIEEGNLKGTNENLFAQLRVRLNGGKITAMRKLLSCSLY